MKFNKQEFMTTMNLLNPIALTGGILGLSGSLSLMGVLIAIILGFSISFIFLISFPITIPIIFLMSIEMDE